MGVAGLFDGVWWSVVAVAGFAGQFDPRVLAAGVSVGMLLMAAAFFRARRRRLVRARASRVEWRVHDLKEQLRQRLAEPRDPFAGIAITAPMLGAGAAFEADLEAAGRSVVLEAGGQRARAKHLLRKRLAGNGLNGTEAACWRQLGALSLLDSTQDALRAYMRAADLAPEDAQAQMLLGVLYLRAGRLEAAEAAFRRQLELAASGPEGAAVRCRAGTMLGDVLAAKGERGEALEAFRRAQQEALPAEGEAPDASSRRDLSLTHDRIGDLHLAGDRLDGALESYRESLAIATALTKDDPANAEALRDLSVTHDRVGEVLERKGDLDGALSAYGESLKIAEALARRDHNRPDLQWDVSASHDRIGDALLAKGKAVEALEAYRRGLAIAERLGEGDRTAWQRDLAASYHKIGLLEATVGNEAEAIEMLERGRAIIARLDRIAEHRAQWRSDLKKFDQALETLHP